MSPLFLPKGMAPDEENEKKGGKNTGDRFNFYDLLFFIVLFTKSGAKRTAWMDGSERTCSFLFLPPSVGFFALLLSAPCPVLCLEPPNFPAPWVRGSREEAAAGRNARRSRRAMGTSVPACCPPRPGIGFLTLPFSTSLYLIGPSACAVDRRRKWLWVLLLLGNGRAYFCAESCSQPRLKTCAGLGWWWC